MTASMSAKDCYGYLVHMVQSVRNAKTPEEFQGAVSQLHGSAAAFEGEVTQSLGAMLPTIDPQLQDSFLLLLTLLEWNKTVMLLITNPLMLAGPELQQLIAQQQHQNGPPSEISEGPEPQPLELGASDLMNQAFAKLDKK